MAPHRAPRAAHHHSDVRAALLGAAVRWALLCAGRCCALASAAARMCSSGVPRAAGLADGSIALVRNRGLPQRRAGERS